MFCNIARLAFDQTNLAWTETLNRNRFTRKNCFFSRRKIDRFDIIRGDTSEQFLFLIEPNLTTPYTA